MVENRLLRTVAGTRRARIAHLLYAVVDLLYLAELCLQDGANVCGQVLLERILVSLDGRIFASLTFAEDRMVVATR